jgi:hypothetical protein
MTAVVQTWQILVTAMAGWITRQQDAVIETLREENLVLKQQLGRNLTDPVDEFLTDMKLLIIDRDSKHSAALLLTARRLQGGAKIVGAIVLIH